jgi:hypothetical protein
MMALGSLIVLAASWLLVLTVLALDFAGVLRRGTAWRWQGSGLLIMNGAVLVNSFLEFRGWPYSRLHTVHWITMPAILAGAVPLGIGLVVLSRQPRKTRSAEPPDE